MKPAEHTAMRSLYQVTADLLWPNQGMCPDPEASLRHSAVADVLQRMPEDAYAKLLEKADTFSWFIPDVGRDIERLGDASIMPFPCISREGCTYAAVLYLSPALERRSSDIRVATVAHELAHIFLGHDPLGANPRQYQQGEAEAWQTVIARGFGKEERAFRKFCREYHSRIKKRGRSKSRR